MNQDENNDKGVDLSHALDKLKIVTSNDGSNQPAPIFYPGTPKIIRWIIIHSGGLVKNTKQASNIILGFLALAIIVSLFLLFSGSKEVKIEAPPGQKIIYPSDGPPRLQQL